MSDSSKKSLNGAGPAGKRRARVLGLTVDDCIRAFFGGNATIAIIILALITYFLAREGLGFFGQNHRSLQVYRQAGLEFVDIIKRQQEEHTALTRYLSDLRLRQFQALTAAGTSIGDANTALTAFDDFAYDFGSAVNPLRGLILDLTDVATIVKVEFTVAEDRREEIRQLRAAGRDADADAVVVNEVDFLQAVRPLIDSITVWRDASAEMVEDMEAAMGRAPPMAAAELEERMDRFRELVAVYRVSIPRTEAELLAWDPSEPIPFGRAISSFFTGSRWLTASAWQDWYGILPLFIGSLLVSGVALCLAVPLGIGSAIYVNQVATPREKAWIKPCIEFIAAIPSVVLGFFGIVVLGEALRTMSQASWLGWVPGFPMIERLNVLTAGCLLALIAIPTIFTLAEDALNNVPRAYREASFALGANKLQTIARITVPASLSGIISAVLLGLGRVIGETMVVLLCAGNRIAIPDFTAGLGVVTQPVHTMTGIIAQEMGEVVQGSIHYRALFLVGLVLFCVSLLINYLAQGIVRRYRISIG